MTRNGWIVGSIAAIVAVLLVAPPASRAEEQLHPRIQSLAATGELLVSAVTTGTDKPKVTALTVCPADVKEKDAPKVTCDCSKATAAWQFAISPVFDARRSRIERYEIVTWEPKEGKAPEAPRYVDLPGSTRQRVETTHALTVRPLVTEKEGSKVVTGFEILAVAAAGRKGTESVERTKAEGGAGTGETRPTERLQPSVAKLMLPAEAKEGERFAIRLVPQWKEGDISGFELSLARDEAKPADAGGSMD